MAFDEKGQADSYDRRVEICQRSYNILVNQVKFPANDIIFDPNIFPVATGIEEHNNNAVDFLEPHVGFEKTYRVPMLAEVSAMFPFLSAETILYEKPCTPLFYTTPFAREWIWGL